MLLLYFNVLSITPTPIHVPIPMNLRSDTPPQELHLLLDQLFKEYEWRDLLETKVGEKCRHMLSQKSQGAHIRSAPGEFIFFKMILVEHIPWRLEVEMWEEFKIRYPDHYASLKQARQFIIDVYHQLTSEDRAQERPMISPRRSHTGENKPLKLAQPMSGSSGLVKSAFSSLDRTESSLAGPQRTKIIKDARSSYHPYLKRKYHFTRPDETTTTCNFSAPYSSSSLHQYTAIRQNNQDVDYNNHPRPYTNSLGSQNPGALSQYQEWPVATSSNASHFGVAKPTSYVTQAPSSTSTEPSIYSNSNIRNLSTFSGWHPAQTMVNTPLPTVLDGNYTTDDLHIPRSNSRYMPFRSEYHTELSSPPPNLLMHSPSACGSTLETQEPVPDHNSVFPMTTSTQGTTSNLSQCNIDSALFPSALGSNYSMQDWQALSDACESYLQSL
ncbi:hypothetical protein BDQ12DRAFT_679561 [Crucibulum laeve]|uniref:Uncharacterized protein n=1 Tax=Crucibulum laeve TaxID=68775 RepID=A0A5C3M5B5_9AGAR|nr:hypothetical protein BDQ12DRAFT_679561 [Crucibulum laeve]